MRRFFIGAGVTIAQVSAGSLLRPRLRHCFGSTFGMAMLPGSRFVRCLGALKAE
jgi:hypothetical protein